MMKTKTVMISGRTDLREFTCTYRGSMPTKIEEISSLCGVSFGHDPIEFASPEDIAEHMKHGSGLCWIESAANMLLNGGAIRKF